MPPVKDEKTSQQPLNTTAQIQQIFSQVQLQLPSVNFDNDDDDDDDDSNDNDVDEDILQSSITENTDDLLESLSNNYSTAFLTAYPRTESPQQQQQQQPPPSVELQMRVSPNSFDHSLQHQDSPPKPSFLSMDLFNSIDFDKLPSMTANHDLPQHPTITRTFHRPRPTKYANSSSQQQANTNNRDDRQILERLAQQASKFHNNEKSPPKREQRPFQNLESALFPRAHEHFDRHGKRIGISESERKTIYIDLRNSNGQQQQQARAQHEQPFINSMNSSSQPTQASDSESDDDEERDDGMLWFEKRRQQRLNSAK